MPLNGSFLDKNGLTYLWSKLKTKFATKQDTIADLSDIRSGAASGATAVQQTAFETDQQRQETEIGAVANAGAKNILLITNKKDTLVTNGITFTKNADQTITATGTATANADYPLNSAQTLELGKSYILSGCPNGGVDSFFIRQLGGAIDYGDGTTFTAESSSANFFIRIRNGYAIQESLIFKPMIRPASITDDTFVPYAPTNRELYEEKIGIEDAFGSGTEILTNGTADITEIGNFYCKSAAVAATVTNAPWTDGGFFGFVKRSVLPSERFIQIAFKNNDAMSIAKRRYTGTWQPWSYSSAEPRSVGFSAIMSYADSLSTPGIYFAYHTSESGTDKPVSGHGFMYQIMMLSSNYGCINAYELNPSSGSVMYIVNKINGAWGSWYKFEGSAAP